MDKFITLFYCILDVKKRTILYTNARHNPPYSLHSDGTSETLETGGLILGVMPDAPYQSATVKLKIGDILFMFTDGITEAMNANNEEYGEKRLEPLLSSLVNLKLVDIVSKVDDQIEEFVGNMPQADDMTVLALKISTD